MYICKLVNKRGQVLLHFLREGTSAQDVKSGLEMFEWPEGEWVVAESGAEWFIEGTDGIEEGMK